MSELINESEFLTEGVCEPGDWHFPMFFQRVNVFQLYVKSILLWFPLIPVMRTSAISLALPITPL